MSLSVSSPANYPSFSVSDLSLARATLKERFGFDVDVQEAETEVRLSPGDRELALCPAIFWQVEKCSFVVAKTGPAGYRAMFFYSIKDRFGTSKEEYDNLGDCLITLLKVQEKEHERRQQETGVR
jgi:hypothetical protein